jgi:hypothetical protein
MRYFGVRLPIFAVILSLGLSLSAWSMDLGYRETVLLWPTTAITTIPTAYVVPRAYYAPAAYVAPSSYVATTYFSDSVWVEPTSYVATAYRTGLFRRRWVVERPLVAAYETSYWPTAYVVPTYYSTGFRTRRYTPTVYEVPAVRRYAPTVYEVPTVWETAYASPTSVDCDDSVWPQSATSVRSSSTGVRSPDSVTRSSPVTSEPIDDGISSRVDPVAKPKADAAGTKDTSPPPPAAVREQNTATPAKDASKAAIKSQVAPDAAKSKAAADPAAVDDEPVFPAPKAGDEATLKRDSFRPTYATPRRPELRNVLMGRVETEAGEAREQVELIVSNRANTAIRRDGLTDALGNFAIRLGDGEWTVNVRMPSGRIYPVRTVAVFDGKVTDERERREVRNLIISY